MLPIACGMTSRVLGESTLRSSVCIHLDCPLPPHLPSLLVKRRGQRHIFALHAARHSLKCLVLLVTLTVSWSLHSQAGISSSMTWVTFIDREELGPDSWIEIVAALYACVAWKGALCTLSPLCGLAQANQGPALNLNKVYRAIFHTQMNVIFQLCSAGNRSSNS